ncbi:DUF2339 domain-containing protein [Paracoccaceae bacterium Fryx2]|nr:DUF2339 domain-containing protein [Paracoccaceae bacterium Fryx2]
MIGWVLAAALVLGLPVAVLILWLRVSGLMRSTRALEAELAALRRKLASGAVVPDAVVTEAEAETILLPPAPTPEDVPAPGPWTPPETELSGPIVLRPDRLAALARWLRENWVYAVSALSLALAGVFFVQYGVERGLLPPLARVGLAILLGAALIVAGETLRRRFGDREGATAYLPSTFAGAGLVSIFAGVLAARQMYGLIGAETAFAGLMATAALAVALGWVYGPLLAAVGLLGAAAAPFLVGGDGASDWLYAHFALVAAVGLAVDAVRRWAWVSVLALALGYTGGGLILLGSQGSAGMSLLLVVLAGLAVLLPVLRVWPDHPRPMIAEALWPRGPWPEFPVRLAGGAVLASSLGLMVVQGGAGDSLLAFALLAGLAAVLCLWSARAPGLGDLAALPAAAFLFRLVQEAQAGPLAREFAGQALDLRAPESAAPLTVSVLLALATLITLAGASRALARGVAYPVASGLAAVLVAPLAALGLELFWHPAPVLGAYGWALHVMALAAVMVGLTVAFARADADLRRAAHATLAALSLIALALFLVTTKTALTLALAALAVVAAALDRRFRLPEMAWFIQAAVAVLGWRLLVDPGLDWASFAPLGQVVLAFGGTLAGLAAAYLLLGAERVSARVVLTSGFAGFAALFATVLVERWLDAMAGADWAFSHWGLVLAGLPWLIVMLVHLVRLPLGGWLRWVRAGMAALAGLVFAAFLLLALGPANPLLADPRDLAALVRGPLVLDTLLLAYGVPGLILLAAALRLPLPRLLRLGFLVLGAALLVLYAGLEIRRIWRGPALGVPGVTQPELYSYTLALMLSGAALLWQAIARRSQGLRRLAMAVIGLTVAKVFLIDASGLSGLVRVVSFLGLGLTLAGLAWLNRWAAARQAG